MAKDWMAGAVKKPGALRATAKREGLIKRNEKLSSADLNKLGKSRSALTRERVNLAKIFAKSNKA